MATIVRVYGVYTEVTKTPDRNPTCRISNSRISGVRIGKKHQSRGKRRADSLRRSKQIVIRRMFEAERLYGVPLFITLTFRDEPSLEYAADCLSSFFSALRTLPGFKCAVAVPEYGKKKGRFHYHMAAYGLPELMGDIRKGKKILREGTERKTRTLARLWGVGFVDCLATDGDVRFAWHFAKYTAKASTCAALDGCRLVNVSRGFPHETTYRGFDAEDIECAMKREPDWEWSGTIPGIGRVMKKIYTKVEKLSTPHFED